MRLANLTGRLVATTADGVVDIAQASEGQFGPDPHAVLDRWREFRQWSRDAGLDSAGAEPPPAAHSALGPVIPRPRQVFAIGLNYRDHSAEAGFTLPTQPMVFTKFPSCLTGPYGEVALPGSTVDWEIELVAVVGQESWQVPPAAAWDHLAGLTIGQDLSERTVQLLGSPAQFSLGKSYPGFGPVGPCLVTVDELADPSALDLTCLLNGEPVQLGNTRDLVFNIPTLVSYLSGICRLWPGDLIFTGTPPGVGMGRQPPRYLAPGDVLESRITGLGGMRHQLVGG